MFFPPNSSKMDTLLQNPNVTLEMILDQVEIYELQSPQFANYVLNNQLLDKMLYLLNSDENGSRTEQIRYPFMISEILSVNEIIVDNFEASHYFYLFEILDKDTLNLTQAGYLSKVALCLLRKRGHEVWECLTANMNYLSDLIKHLDIFHITQIIEQLLQFQQHPYQQQLLSRVANYMVAKSHEKEVVENCCYILNEVMLHDENLRYIEFTCIPDKFFTVAVKSQSPKPLQLIITLIDLIQKYIKTREPEYKFNYFQFLGLAADFGIILENKENISRFESTYGTQQQTFSQFKIKLLELYLAILRINDQPLTSQFDHQRIFESILQYLLDHEFNNALQILFYEITTFIFLNQDYVQIQQTLYFQVKIQDFISKNNILQKESNGQLKHPIKKGYCGILNKLSYFFHHMFPDQGWTDYLQHLEIIRLIECSYLLGVNPREGPPSGPIQPEEQQQVEQQTNWIPEQKQNQEQHVNEQNQEQQNAEQQHQEQTNQINENQEEQTQENRIQIELNVVQEQIISQELVEQ